MSISKNNEWLWQSPVSLHIDNHSQPLGLGLSVDEIASMLQEIPVDIVQVAAFGNTGIPVNFPTEAGEEYRDPQTPDWDTLGIWSEAVKKAGKRFHVYINLMASALGDSHPEWIMLDKDENPFVPPWHKGVLKKLRPILCAKPDPDGKGLLETFLIPMLEEISAKYHPKGFWIDGDTNRVTCRCQKCMKAWGDRSISTTEDIKAWEDFHLERHTAMVQTIYNTIHKQDTDIVVGFNNNWLNNVSPPFLNDPRSSRYADFLTRDLQNFRQTRLRYLFHSACTDVPFDTMSLVYYSREINMKLAISERRLLQHGALSISDGGGWWLWVGGNSFPKAEAEMIRERVRNAAEFAKKRIRAYGRSSSLNNTAVLISETAWLKAKYDGGDWNAFNIEQPNSLAMALLDRGHTVDIVNEDMLNQNISHYKVVFVPGQKLVAQEIYVLLENYVHNGGTLVVQNGAFSDNKQNNLPADFMSAVSKAQNSDGIIISSYGNGKIIGLASSRLRYPDQVEFINSSLVQANILPDYKIDTGSLQRHIILSARKRHDAEMILHLADITSFKDGERIHPDSREDTDDEDVPQLEVKLDFPMDVKPGSVEIVPDNAVCNWDWADGILHVLITGMDIHCSLIIDTN